MSVNFTRLHGATSQKTVIFNDHENYCLHIFVSTRIKETILAEMIINGGLRMTGEKVGMPYFMLGVIYVPSVYTSVFVTYANIIEVIIIEKTLTKLT
jgi:hypothetical protein